MIVIPSILLADPQGFVTHLAEAPTKTHGSGTQVQFLASPKLHSNENLFVSRLVIPANGSVPEHRDPTEEYLYILSGDGTIWINGLRKRVIRGDTVFMPAQAKVKFVAGGSPVEVLQIFAPSGPEKKYEGWKGLEKKASPK